MKRRAICIAFFLAFLVLLSLVQESQEITGILIPRRIPKCRRASNRRKVRSCRRGTIKSLVPVFVFTETEIKRQKFLRQVANISQVYFVLLCRIAVKRESSLPLDFTPFYQTLKRFALATSFINKLSSKVSPLSPLMRWQAAHSKIRRHN